MAGIIAIVGRPNVGKSTLFNYLTKSKQALVADWPGVTRDRQYGCGKVGDQPYWVVDTGGLSEPDNPNMAELTDSQVLIALAECDRVIFLVDCEQGLTAPDRMIAQQLRQQYADKIILAVNKVDRQNEVEAMSDFYQLGFAHTQAISAKSGRGVKALIDLSLKDIESFSVDIESMPGARVAIVGRPNVGKSTLTNQMLGEERVVVFDQPGTTRDSVAVPYKRRGQQYTLIDTAGVRRRAKVHEAIEAYSVIKTIKSMEMAQVVLIVIDASEGVTDQDLRLIGKVVHLGKAIVLVFNKWDNLDEEARKLFMQSADRKLKFIHYARQFTISALHGTGVSHLYRAIDEAYKAVNVQISTADMTRALLIAQQEHQPPLIANRRIKLRYAHVGWHDPLTIIIHGKQLSKLPGSYKTYLSNFFRKHFKIPALPILLIFKTDNNPYAD